MLDANARLREAQRALHHLELEIEQYRLHIEGLAAHPREAEQARAALERLTAQLASQRTYCDVLAKTDGAGNRATKKVSRVA
jgi:DNA repair exonuclease SbcCD ATPase subunit